MNRRQRRMVENSKGFSDAITEQRFHMLQSSLLAGMEVLKEEFDFTPEQLNKFAESHNKKLGDILKGVSK